MMTRDYLGRGWALPLGPQGSGLPSLGGEGRGVAAASPISPEILQTPRRGPGSFAYVAGAEKVRQAIQIILETEPGERIMRPGFGCGLRRYLMHPNNTATRALMRHEVEEALTAWEPRIRLEEVQVEPGDDPSLVFIQISYVHRQDGSKDNLVFPFCLE